MLYEFLAIKQIVKISINQNFTYRMSYKNAKNSPQGFYALLSLLLHNR